jgi:uncharacterized membrane protein
MSTSQSAGVVAASASVPRSLVPLLHARSAADQGLITGLTAAMNYAFTATAHEAARGTARRVLRNSDSEISAGRLSRTTMAVNLLALGVSSVVYAALPRRVNESAIRAFARATARHTAAASVAGLVAEVLDELPGDNRRLRAMLNNPSTVIAIGAGVSGTVHGINTRRLHAAGANFNRDRRPPMAKSIAMGALMATGVVGLAFLERRAARGIGAFVGKGRKGTRGGAVVSHLVSAGVIGGVIGGVGSQYFRRAERAMSTPDPNLHLPSDSSHVSGGQGSVIDWNPLTREVRRHLASVTTAERIASVMGEPAMDPIRIYVGLTSASTIDERVSLALAEIARTGALDRSLLVLCSPTGSGFINYAASAAWEYLSRGDCASVTLQYAARPSWLSLDRVKVGRKQNRAMWTALGKVLAQREPTRRPRVVLFGESLGAHTSQDAFLHAGTQGLHALFVERALWLGTPYASGWVSEVHDPFHPNPLPGEVLRVTSADDLDNLEPAVAEVSRYVLIAHEDDAVTLFGPSLLVEHPWWLGEERPPSVPPQARWSSPLTFLQSAVDAKNVGTMTPGEFGSCGHDYRADAARGVRFAFDLPCTDSQLAAVEGALRREEQTRIAAWS